MKPFCVLSPLYTYKHTYVCACIHTHTHKDSCTQSPLILTLALQGQSASPHVTEGDAVVEREVKWTKLTWAVRSGV